MNNSHLMQIAAFKTQKDHTVYSFQGSGGEQTLAKNFAEYP